MPSVPKYAQGRISIYPFVINNLCPERLLYPVFRGAIPGGPCFQLFKLPGSLLTAPSWRDCQSLIWLKTKQRNMIEARYAGLCLTDD